MADGRQAKLQEELRHYDTKHSPFLELQTPFTAWEAVKMVLLLPLVLPRLVCGISACLLLAALSYVAVLHQDIEKPLPPRRRKLVELASKCAGVVLVMLGFRLRTKGFEHVAQARQLGAIGIFNHTSWVDSIVLMWLFAPSGVSLASNADIPLVGTCIKAFQNIYVPRTSHGSARKVKDLDLAGDPGSKRERSVSDMIADRYRHSAPPKLLLDIRLDNAAIETAQLHTERAKDRRFPMLVAAPEGTCSDGRCILQFRSGVFLPGAPVLPIMLQYDKRRHNPAWTIIHEGWHFLRMMCQFYNTVDVTILPAYTPNKQELTDHRLFAANVRRLFSDTLKLPLIEQGVPHYAALNHGGVRVSLDGRRVYAPPGVLDEHGFANLLQEQYGKA